MVIDLLIENQRIKIKWSRSNEEHYKSLGYKFTKYGDEFEARAEDLTPKSTKKVKVLCDLCKEVIIEREYRHYLIEHDEEFGDTCRKCNREKYKKTCLERYGVEWGIQSEQFKKKQRETCMSLYGVEYISQDKNFRKTVEDSVYRKYGVKNVSQVPEIQEKKSDSFYKNGTCATSKQQIELNKMLSNIYGDSKLNYKCGRYLLDCAIEVDGVKIDVEYDGKYWHKDTKDKDRKRNNYVISKGYKVLRILSNYKLPEKFVLVKAIKELIETDIQIKIIDIE